MFMEHKFHYQKGIIILSIIIINFIQNNCDNMINYGSEKKCYDTFSCFLTISPNFSFAVILPLIPFLV